MKKALFLCAFVWLASLAGCYDDIDVAPLCGGGGGHGGGGGAEATTQAAGGDAGDGGSGGGQ